VQKKEVLAIEGDNLVI